MAREPVHSHFAPRTTGGRLKVQGEVAGLSVLVDGDRVTVQGRAIGGRPLSDYEVPYLGTSIPVSDHKQERAAAMLADLYGDTADPYEPPSEDLADLDELTRWDDDWLEAAHETAVGEVYEAA